MARIATDGVDLAPSRDVAQLVECLLWEQVVARSNRVIPIVCRISTLPRFFIEAGEIFALTPLEEKSWPRRKKLSFSSI